jgi:hypothetical protein
MMLREKLFKMTVLAIICIHWFAPRVEAAPVPVHFIEGVSRGFLTLRSQDNVKLAEGDLLQAVKENVVESRLVFHFADGSLYDETVVFSQHRTFALQRYHLVQRGPSFPSTMDVSFDRKTGQYNCRYANKQGSEKRLSGSFKMPPDLYNGLTGTLLRNLPRGASETVQMVVFTPKPRLVKLHLSPFGEESIPVGDIPKPATHYQIVPEIGGILGFFASLIGKKPPTLHYWMTRDEAPAFLAFEGPLYLDGPVWRVGSSYRTEPPREDSKKK